MEIKVLEVSAIEQLATMAKDHAILMIACILNMSYDEASLVYKLLFG
jgi:hypothetical protein